MAFDMNETDEKLYRRFLERGESDDLRILLERYNESLTLFINGFVHSMEDAEELMLDTFAIAASGTSRFRGNSTFKTWLFGIGRNLALKHLKKHRISEVPINEETLGKTYHEDLGLSLLSKERNAKLYRALSELNPDYRQALYLIYFEDMSTEEAASVMGKNKKQFYNLVSRGKTALKGVLERMGIDDEI